MKVAVFHNLPSGGAKRSLYDLVKYLNREGCHIDVFVPSSANESFLPLIRFADSVTIVPVRRTFLGMIKSTMRYLLPLNVSLSDLETAQIQIANTINNGDYDVVFVEQDRYTMSPFILKYIKKHCVYYCQQPRRSKEVVLNRLAKDSDSLLKKIWKRYSSDKLDLIDRENASFAKTILANSHFSKESILKTYGLNAFVSYLGVDTEIFKPLNIIRDSYVLSVGRIIPAKGFDFVIRALSLVDGKIRPKLMIVGDDLSDRWKKYIEKLASDGEVSLEIKTLIEESELVKLYNRASLCLYAPYREPFGLVPLEAMACGTAVVAVKEGGVGESVVHNKTVLLTNRNEKEFAQAVTTLLLDQNKRLSMGLESLEVIKDFWTSERSAQRIFSYLQSAIKE